MAKQVISLGVNANDHLGDPLRTAFTKVNSNFTEVYNSIESINNQPSPVFNGGNISQPLRITNDTNTSGLSTGALSVKGGASVDRSLYVNDTLFLGSGSIPNELVSPAIVARKTGEQYTQGALINSSSTGSADWVAYGDIGTNEHGWADMGFTGSFFNDPAYTITETGDGYVFASGYPNGISHGSLVLATDSTGIHNDIDFGTGGFFIENVRMSLVDNTQQLEVYMDTESTSVDTGSITTAGGVGIAKDLYVGGNINLSAGSSIVDSNGENVLIDLSNVNESIIPDITLTHDLGSPTKRWHSLYVGEGSIYVGDAVISLENGKLQSSVGFAGSLTTSRTSSGVTGFELGMGVVLTKDSNDRYVSLNGATSLTLGAELQPGSTSVYISYILDDGSTGTITQGIAINGTALTLSSPLPSNLSEGIGVSILATYDGPTYTFPAGVYGPYSGALTITEYGNAETGDYGNQTSATYSYTLDENGYLETITIIDSGYDYGQAQDNRYVALTPTTPNLEPIRLTSVGGTVQGLGGSTWTTGTYTAVTTIGGSTVSVNYTVSEFADPPQFANRFVTFNSFTSSQLLTAGSYNLGILYISKDNPTVVNSTQTNDDDVLFYFGSQLEGASIGYIVDAVETTQEFNGSYSDLIDAPIIPVDISDLTDTEGLLGGSGSSNILTNSTQTFSLNEEGNVIFSGETGGVNRGLVWDYGAEVGGENSTVRQDVAGLSVRAWTEVLDNEELYSAPVNIVTNQDGNAKVWTFDGDGNLALPAGGSITEGIVTDNPTIELAPANPSVESQKLVIKGGGGYYAEANGIWINLSNITLQVGDTVTAYIGSETYAGQTLYWWIVPEESGISDPGFGTVTLDESGLGNFSFEVDNEDEFTVRVSQVENVYDPTTGVESLTINGDIGDHHLHLTTGDLAETSIFLGTDNHNVRTTVDGGIQITTPNVTDNVWQFGADGDITLPASGNVVDSTGVGQLANRVEGSWTVTSGTNTYSFTVPSDGTYTMWVKCNIPNGIIVWNATASVSNSNVPAIGTQYAWNYTGGGSPILLTAIPDQIVGTAGGISTDNTYVGTTSNRFDFTIANTSGETQIVYYGYTKV